MSLFFSDEPYPTHSTPLTIPSTKRGINPSQFQYILSKLKSTATLTPETVFLHKGVAQSLVYTEPSGTLAFKGTSQKGGVLQLDPIIRDFLRLQRQRQISEVAAVRFVQDAAVRFLSADELTAMLKNRRKGWMDVLMIQLLPWKAEGVYVNYAFSKSGNALNVKVENEQNTRIEQKCREFCFRISEHLFPPTVAQDLASGDFEFAYMPESDTLWLLYVNNLKTTNKTPVLENVEVAKIPRTTNIIDKEGTMKAMIKRGVELGLLVKEYERVVVEQRLLTEESRNFKRVSVDKKKGPEIPCEVKEYLNKYHMLQEHYKQQIALMK
jgi:hypothetical protein